jgi:hypothetical protein
MNRSEQVKHSNNPKISEAPGGNKQGIRGYTRRKSDNMTRLHPIPKKTPHMNVVKYTKIGGHENREDSASVVSISHEAVNAVFLFWRG